MYHSKRRDYSYVPTHPFKVAKDAYIENIRRTVKLVTDPTSTYHSPKTRVILLTPPPVNLNQRPTDNERDLGRTKEYAEMVIALGKELSLPVVDVWAAFWQAAGEEENGLAPLLSDGLHLTADGYQVYRLPFA